jgi:S1-C subfamily serine protease
MQRAALYSSASKSRAAVASEPPAAAAPAPPAPEVRFARWRRVVQAYRVQLLVLAGVLAVFSGAVLERQLTEPPVPVTQQDIDRAVRVSLEKKPLPSQAAKAFEVIRPAVVRVEGFDHPEGSGAKAKPAGKSPKDKGKDKSDDENTSIGTGVVITEKGAILTNLHVVAGTSRIQVAFADGSESAAKVVGIDADNDLAVLQANKLPDDLQAATLVTTGDLRPGDEVLAVGFPFGFGPSVSAGVVSGLKREFRSTDDKRVLSNLIQFDAAANPGNSGGPLVNMEGEVLGIVTAILNPTQQRFFVGLAFAVPIENAAAAVGVSPF